MLATLYAIAILGLLIFGGNGLWLAVQHVRAERLRRGPVPAPDRLPEPPEDWPVVTVQCPLYNEAGVAERLIDACARLDYPRRALEIQVLDDSSDETSERVARRVRHWQEQGYDITHVQRAERTGYKAGALANGLRLARGELMAVFDADFVPPPDFLRRTVPRLLADDDLGMVQARWGHLNARDSLLTCVQAFGLDAHFALEQQARGQAGCFINFNGTAGLWRRACIEDAGGWQGDTLTEDLDLSYRAQLKGWRFAYLSDVEVPAELPAEMSALRTQQRRWAKGAIETARKMLGSLWGSGQPLRVRGEGTLHLLAHLSFPLVLLAALVHPVLILLKSLGYGPGLLYFATLSWGLVGFAGFFLVQLFAQRALYPDWGRRLRLFPVFAAGTIGLALSNTLAVLRGLWGRDTRFVRTPKQGTGRGPWWKNRYAGLNLPHRGLPAVVWGEMGMALYSVVGLGGVVYGGEWAALPFQALFATGFALVALSSVRQIQAVRQAQSDR